MHINLATESAGQAGQNEMLKKYLLFVKKNGRPLKSAPTHRPLTPSQARRNAVAERSRKAISSQKLKG